MSVSNLLQVPRQWRLFLGQSPLLNCVVVKYKWHQYHFPLKRINMSPWFLSEFIIMSWSFCNYLHCSRLLINNTENLKYETGRNTWWVMGDTQRNWGNNKWNRSKCMGKSGRCIQVITTKRFLRHVFTSFRSTPYIAGFPHEWLPNILYEQIAAHCFHGFRPYMVSYAMFISMAVGCRSGMFVLSFHGGSAART